MQIPFENTSPSPSSATFAFKSPENLRLFIIVYPSSLGGIHLKTTARFSGATSPVAKTSVWLEVAANTTLGLAVIRARFFEPPCIVVYLAPDNSIAECFSDKAKRVYCAADVIPKILPVCLLQRRLIESRIISCQSRQREDCFQKAVIKRGLRRMRRSVLRARSSSSQ